MPNVQRALVFIGMISVLTPHSEVFARPKLKKVGCVGALSLAGVIGIPSAVLGSHQVISNVIYASRPTDKSVLLTEGASITGGTGASLPIQMRLRHHLQENNIDIESLMPDQSIFIMADFFFPTNYTNLSSASEQEIRDDVRSIILERLSQHQFVLAGLLPTSSDINQELLSEVSPDHPTRFVLSFLESDEVTKRNTKAVNQTLRELAEQNPKMILLDQHEFMQNLLDHPEQAMSRFPDRIHPNDNGQADYINRVILPALNQIPDIKNMIPELKMRNAYQELLQKLNQLPYVGAVTTDFAEQAMGAQAQSAQDFINRKPGLYWADMGGAEQMIGQLENSLTLPSSPLDQYRDFGEKDLVAIRDAIKGYSSILAHGFPLSLSNSSGSPSVTLQLTQAFFYTSIELKEVSPGSGVFEAYGYDFWLSVDKDMPPKVNYYFQVTLDPENPDKFDLLWRIFPLVRDDEGKILQETPLMRKAYLEQKPTDFIQENADLMPFLEFQLKMTVGN